MPFSPPFGPPEPRCASPTELSSRRDEINERTREWEARKALRSSRSVGSMRSETDADANASLASSRPPTQQEMRLATEAQLVVSCLAPGAIDVIDTLPLSYDDLPPQLQVKWVQATTDMDPPSASIVRSLVQAKKRWASSVVKANIFLDYRRRADRTLRLIRTAVGQGLAGRLERFLDLYESARLWQVDRTVYEDHCARVKVKKAVFEKALRRGLSRRFSKFLDPWGRARLRRTSLRMYRLDCQRVKLSTEALAEGLTTVALFLGNRDIFLGLANTCKGHRLTLEAWAFDHCREESHDATYDCEVLKQALSLAEAEHSADAMGTLKSTSKLMNDSYRRGLISFPHDWKYQPVPQSVLAVVAATQLVFRDPPLKALMIPDPAGKREPFELSDRKFYPDWESFKMKQVKHIALRIKKLMGLRGYFDFKPLEANEFNNLKYILEEISFNELSQVSMVLAVFSVCLKTFIKVREVCRANPSVLRVFHAEVRKEKARDRLLDLRSAPRLA